MSIAGWLQIILVLALVIAAAIPLAAYINHVLAGRAHLSLAGAWRPSSAASTAWPASTRGRSKAGLPIRWRCSIFSLFHLLVLYAMQRLQNHPAARSARLRSGGAGSRLQHLDELRHQHQLAELRGRDDAHPFRADARPHGAQLALAGGRPRHGGRAGARLHSLGGADHRQFLGRYDPRDALRHAAAVDRDGARARRARRAADLCSARSTRRRSKASSKRSRSGPSRRQEAIKELGTNGGGFFNANSAHPFENPNAWTNIIENWSLLVIPVATVFAFGKHARRCAPRPQPPLDDGPSSSFVGVVAVYWAEAYGNPILTALGARSLGRQYGGQRGPLRPGDDRPLGGDDDGHEHRRGERHARFARPRSAASCRSSTC